MKMRNGITAGGTWITDYTKIVDMYPSQGASTRILKEAVSNGGAPYNLLINLRKLGCDFPLRAVGCVGKDWDGLNIIKNCHAHTIDHSALKVIPGETTSFTDVMTVQSTGIRTTFNLSGANDFLTEEDFALSDDPSKILYLGTLFFLKGLDLPHSKYGTMAAKVLHRARKHDMITCVDIERADHLNQLTFIRNAMASLRYTDVIILNIEVAEILTGQQTRARDEIDLDKIEFCARQILVKTGAKIVIIRFPRGAIAVQLKQTTVEGSVRIPKSRIISGSGAGHAFASGFLYGWHEDWKTEKCLQAAHATSATCLMDATSSGGVRPIQTALALLAKYGSRDIQQYC